MVWIKAPFMLVALPSEARAASSALSDAGVTILLDVFAIVMVP
jgi:hypothetical protein